MMFKIEFIIIIRLLLNFKTSSGIMINSKHTYLTIYTWRLHLEKI